MTCSKALCVLQCRQAVLHHVICSLRESVLMHGAGESLHTGLHIVVIESFGENLQSRQELLLRPYVWLYETLNDEHSSCQAHGDIHLASAPS